MNFVVDDSVRLEWQGNEAAHRLVAFNDRQALGPSPQTAFFAGERWPPGDWFVKFFRLTYEPRQPHTGPIPGRLVLELADDRLNARGHRWLPILVVRRDLTWPPPPRPGPNATTGSAASAGPPPNPAATSPAGRHTPRRPQHPARRQQQRRQRSRGAANPGLDDVRAEADTGEPTQRPSPKPPRTPTMCASMRWWPLERSPDLGRLQR